MIESKIFNASGLVDARAMGAMPGNPAWLNTAFRAKSGASQLGLGGPGIYAMFFDRALVYVGCYAGTNKTPYGGSVLSERWLRLLGVTTMRGQKVSLDDSARQYLVQSHLGAPLYDLAEALRNPTAPVFRNKGMQMPDRKMVWAAAKWNRLSGPLHEVMGSIDFVYVRLSPETGIGGGEMTPWNLSNGRASMMEWLRPIELRLIKQLNPTLNAESNPAPTDRSAGPEEVRELIQSHMRDALTRFGCAPWSPTDCEDSDVAVGGATGARAVFMTGLPKAAEAFIKDMEKILPAQDRLILHYTHDGKELRIGKPWSKRRIRPVMILEWRDRGKFSQSFKVRTRAPLREVSAAGFDPRDSGDQRMKVEFACDPAAHDINNLQYLVERTLQDIDTRRGAA